LLKQLTYEISRLTKTNIATFDNDAKACFDRIVMCFAMHRAQQLGMPTKSCKMLGAYLDNVQQYIKTKLGVSTEYYQSTPEDPLHGAGQGSKAGPDLWKYVSTAAMEVLDNCNPGIKFVNPQRTLTAGRPIDGFFDDTTTWGAKFLLELITFTRDGYDDNTAMAILNDIVTETTQLAQHWEELLWSTGGQLELKKCFYYIVSWWFDEKGGAHMHTLKELKDRNIKIDITQSETNTPATIKPKDCREAHRTLGPMICPDEKNKEEPDRLLIKANKMARSVEGNKMSKYEAFTLYRCIFIPSLAYSLPAIFMTSYN
jgi:hypothetical protein